MEHNILIPLLLTLGAGLATGIGSAIAFFARRTNKRLLSFSLGLSGGVMIYVSFVELFQQAHTTLSDEWGAQTGIIVTVASFFAGILLIGIIDRLGGLAHYRGGDVIGAYAALWDLDLQRVLRIAPSAREIRDEARCETYDQRREVDDVDQQ